jgi:PiT family inorganic phosphate transporter
MFILPDGNVALNWKKVADAGISLLVSPVVGFGSTMLLMWIFKKLVKKKKFFQEPSMDKKPPFWIRAVLVLTCTSVSFSHGSNDGQKGVGLVMIILIAILPGYFALDSSKNTTNMVGNVNQVIYYVNKIDTTQLSSSSIKLFADIKTASLKLHEITDNAVGPDEIPLEKRKEVRNYISKISKNSEKLLECKECQDCSCLNLTSKERSHFKDNVVELKSFIEYAPWWVILMISVSLGIGTMIGWKRIVVTIGEKIGKSHLTYAQGASAEIIAANTIGISSALGLPVSTTHVLSSGIAGSMVSQGGLKNLQKGTVRNILIAWVITIPITVLLSLGLFLLFVQIF